MQTHHTVIVGDARRLRERMEGPVDLVVTSPPYPMIAMWDEMFRHQDPAIGDALAHGQADRAFELMHRLLDPVWEALAACVRPGGIICINVGDATRTMDGTFRLFSNHTRIMRRCLECGLINLPNILWRKQTNAPTKFMGSGMLPPGAYVTLEHEHILIFRTPGRRPFATQEEKARRQRSAFFWEERNSWFSDLWELKGIGQERQAAAGGRLRSAAFPFALAYRLINMFSLQEDTVLDPFLGSGTTMLAAMAAARSSTGIEMDAALAGSVQERLGPACVGELAAAAAARLAAHRTFTEARTDLSFRYINAHHGVPVMTRQETLLVIPSAAALERAGDQVRVTYTPPA